MLKIEGGNKNRKNLVKPFNALNGYDGWRKGIEVKHRKTRTNVLLAPRKDIQEKQKQMADKTEN